MDLIVSIFSYLIGDMQQIDKIEGLGGGIRSVFASQNGRRARTFMLACAVQHPAMRGELRAVLTGLC